MQNFVLCTELENNAPSKSVTALHFPFAHLHYFQIPTWNLHMRVGGPILFLSDTLSQKPGPIIAYLLLLFTLNRTQALLTQSCSDNFSLFFK